MNRFSRRAFTAALLVASAPLVVSWRAAADTPSSTSFQSAPLFPASALSLKVLPNGVRAIVRQTRGTGLVCVQVWARAGSRAESENESGAAHLVETLALRASKNYPRSLGELSGGAADAIEALGGNVNSLTSRDAVFFSATVATAYLPQAMRALSDGVLRPTLSDGAVEEAKVDVLTQQQIRESDPLLAVADLSYRAAFAKHPYRKAAGGSTQNVESIAPRIVREFYRRAYRGDALSVVVVGDVSPTAAQKMVADNFGAAPKATTVAPKIAPEIAPTAFKQVVRQRSINRTAVALAFRAPSVSQTNDVIAMDVLLALWREGSQAALRRALLEPRDGKTLDPDTAESEQTPVSPPLALGYDVDYLTQRDPSLFVITMAVEPTDRRAATDAVLSAIAQVQENGVGKDALERAKRLLTQQYVAQSETVSGQAGALGFYDMIESYDFAVKYLPRIARVTSADLQRVAKTYLSRTKYLQTVIEPGVREPAPEPNRNTITAQNVAPQRENAAG